METLINALFNALQLIFSPTHELLEIIFLTLKVSGFALAFATIIGLPIGATLALRRFPLRGFLIALLNAFMGLPPVVVGLTVYLILSHSGPLGFLELLFTPTAMIIAQFILVTPIIAALTRQTVADLHEEYEEQLRSLGSRRFGMALALLWDGRFSLITAVLAGFGRAFAEVGAVIIVGGNINHVTRIMTTAIVLETSKGSLPLALALGLVLIGLSLSINLAAMGMRDVAYRHYG
jgi:tungstate transport system permease protein